MNDDVTSRLALPLMQPGQAQKEMTHNEALALLDLACQPVVEAIGVEMPPSDPAPGAAWIVGPAPTAAWSGRAGAIAGWTDGGWRFLLPFDGLAAWSIADGKFARYRDGGWAVGEVRASSLMIDGITVIREQQPAIAEPAGGSVVDAEARAALASVLECLREHGLIAS